MAARLALGALGVLAGLYGAVRLLQTGTDNVTAALWWVAGGVVVHDGLLAPVVVVLTVLALRVLPAAARPWTAAAAVVVGTVTVTAIPVLGRFGARPDNPTLLPRDYVRNWLIVVALVVVGTALLALVRTARERRVSPGPSTGRPPRGR
ncbi:hypothetical protein KC207_01140 [Phycicoccus sp. BSK3Z-2]|uniref:Uncharacterized protein n=1 Tax=Phycicoccus avicenniae TaxID=2828860 RepID=A0A941D5M3_9MICO|nr:hypothetical protein [Phycicoccus avicenniae]MBR7741896.1 hypothetical protein [Phycicoccus avicenniae]